MRDYSSLFLILFLFNLKISAASADAVVRIKVDNMDQGTGFIFGSSKQVVTALHVVAGKTNITVYSEVNSKSSKATVSRVHKESDLALLTLDSDLGLPMLSQNTTPDISQEHTIWGYPRDVATIQGDPIRFSQSRNNNPTLTNIIKPGNKIATALTRQGYPSLDAKILRVSSTIQPGHSGAPIIDSAGRVVGIADGGLYGGTSRINWAIPASYLASLENGIIASDPGFPNSPSVQSDLFSAGKDQVEEPAEIDFGGSELEYVMTVTLEQVIDYIDAKDRDYINSLADDAADLYEGADLLSQQIDVYEDVNSGATISVPRGISIYYDGESGLLEAQSHSSNVEMIVQITVNDSWDEGLEALHNFDSYIMGINEAWINDPQNTEPDIVEDLSKEEFYYYYKARVTMDENQDYVSELFASLIVDEGDFMGTAVLVHDLRELSDEDEMIHYVMTACVDLADFTIN